MYEIFIIIYTVFLSILEPLIINFLYLKNVDLFCTLFVNKKNYDRLKEYFKKES